MRGWALRLVAPGGVCAGLLLQACAAPPEEAGLDREPGPARPAPLGPDREADAAGVPVAGAGPEEAPRTPEHATLLRQAEEAEVRADWPAARGALEAALQAAPRDLDTTLRLAEVRLKAYGEIEEAERLFWGVRDRSRARALHGAGLCALWRGDEAAALRLFRQSLEERPTAACAVDLAARLLARGDDATAVLDALERVAGQTLRARLLLAAAGRAPAPPSLPQGWAYGLERARLLPPAEAAREVEAYLEKACATPRARDLLREVLRGDWALRRNHPASDAVQGEERPPSKP
jgi:hypothetical protein